MPPLFAGGDLPVSDMRQVLELHGEMVEALREAAVLLHSLTLEPEAEELLRLVDRAEGLA